MSFTDIKNLLPNVINKHSLSEGVNAEMILREVNEYFHQNNIKDCEAISIKNNKLNIRVPNSQQSNDLYFLKNEILDICNSINKTSVKYIYFKKV